MSEKELQEKIKVYNFEALKGSIKAHPVFRGAVKTFRKLAATNPDTFREMNEEWREHAEMKREDLGVLGMTPEELLDSILQDIARLPRGQQKKYLDELAGIQQRKRAIENAMLQAVQAKTAAGQPGAANAMVQSGRLSAKDSIDLAETVKLSQAELAQKMAAGLEALAEGMKKMETKRTLQ